MTDVRKIEHWSALQLSDLFYAYRKAKADCFFERQICVAEKFVAFEKDIFANLNGLLENLRKGNIKQLLLANLGEPVLVAKKLGLEKRSEGPDGHGFFSQPERAFDYLLKTHTLIPEFRLAGDFPVEMHVLSALWINTTGHLFDACLKKNAYGSRLRRYRAEPGSPRGKLGRYHLDSIGSFEPYFSPYKQWRSDGMKAIKTELDADRPVIAMSLDLTSYYHNIDPGFIARKGFQDEIGVELNPWEKSFTKAFSEALLEWGKKALAVIKDHKPSSKPQMGGLPIGLAAVRIMANALLWKLDRAFTEGLTPVHYGRYVDDIFLVMRDPETLTDSKDVMEYIRARVAALGEVKNDAREIKLGQTYQGKSRLVLQDKKHKVFFLHGDAGKDLLESIGQEITNVASERRLMPDPDALDRSTAAKVLSAASNASEEADTLRRADGLSVRRMGWSVQLRSVETLARDLRPDNWWEQRHRFYDFARNHILRPDRLLDHIDYLPRLLSLAVSLEDWAQATSLVHVSMQSLKRLKVAASDEKKAKKARINGVEVAEGGETLWDRMESRLRDVCRDAMLRSYPWHNHKPVDLPEAGKTLCELIELNPNDDLAHRARNLRESDWAKIAYKDHLRRDAACFRVEKNGEQNLYLAYEYGDDLARFLGDSADACGTLNTSIHRLGSTSVAPGQSESLLPFLFPTRAYSPQEIALFVPRCVNDGDPDGGAKLWAKYVRAVRGVWVWPRLVEDTEPHDLIDAQEISVDANSIKEKSKGQMWRLGRARKPQAIRLGITNLLTPDRSWFLGADGHVDINPSRYKRIVDIVNQALTANPRPTYLLLPELSLPEVWVDSVSGRLKDAGISLIAGLDYHHPSPKEIFSDVALVLIDDRLGFPASVQIRQRKTVPAPQEEKDLLHKFGRTWRGDDPIKPKPVYSHEGFCFGVLVCSELQNIKHRDRFQGDVDALMVLSWNRDLETFSALIESAALDVHAYIALVNNRRYGDSRVRSPEKEAYRRDLCRLRGGENDYVVIVEIDVESLRAFQSREKNWPDDEDQFKPVPEGFRIHPKRRVTPS